MRGRGEEGREENREEEGFTCSSCILWRILQRSKEEQGRREEGKKKHKGTKKEPKGLYELYVYTDFRKSQLYIFLDLDLF